MAPQDHTASYQAGTITLDGPQFTAWTGITSATAACQLLSSGGIPAAINGSTIADCNYGAASVSTATLSHIWVSATIGGGTYLFDPGHKPYAFNPGIADLSAAATLTPGQALSNASSGMQSGSQSGVGYVRNLNAESLNSTLQTYGTNLLNHIQANMPAGDVEDVAGGADIVRFETPPGGLRLTALPYSSWTIQHTWTGDIPDQYRTTLRVQIVKQTQNPVPPPTFIDTLVIDRTLFVDEIYGRKLVFETNFPFAVGLAQSSTFTAELRLTDHAGNGPAIETYTLANDIATLRDGRITLTADHPYAASASGSAQTGGDYMDGFAAKPVYMLLPLTILHGWGDAGRGLMEAWGTRLDRGVPPVPNEGGCEFCGPSFFASQGDGRREQLAVNWLVQSTRAAQLHAAIARSTFAHHHSLGVVTSDATPFAVSRTPEGTGPFFYTVQNNFDRIDVDTAFSLTSRTANVVDRRAAAFAIAATSEALESGVAAQIADLPDTTSTATRFEWANRPPSGEDLSNNYGPRRFYQFSSANADQALALAVAEGKTSTTDDGFHASGGEPEIGASELGGWRARLSTAISAYANAGFDVVASEDAFLGPGQRAGQYRRANLVTWLHLPTEQRGGALVATRSVNGEPVEIAHIAVGFDEMSKGGGGGAQPTQQAQYDPSTAADVLKTRFVDRSRAIGVDLQSGAVTYAAPATIAVGNGEFPDRLDATLIWRGGAETSDSFGPHIHTQPQTPWTTNWNSTLTMSSSAIEAMGETDARAAAGTIAAFLAQQDVYRATPTTQREAAGALVSAWWLRQISGNVVTVNVGADTRQFVRNVNGQWLAPGAASHAALTQIGQRTITTRTCNWGPPAYVLTRGWDYEGMSFQVTNAHGDVQNFSYWFNQYQDESSPYCANMHGFRLSSWIFPRGVTINLVYQTPGFGALDRLAEVNNNLGRRIRFSYDPSHNLTGLDNGLSGADARAVSITRDTLGKIISVTDSAGAITRFTTSIVGEMHRLDSAFDADDAALPSLGYTYDALDRVMEARDAVALQQGTRGPYQFFIAPGGGRGERVDPAGGSYAVLFDEERRPFRHIERIDASTARTTSVEFDGRGRVTKYVYPELDEERLQYDDRNNVTQFRRCPKQGCGVSDIVVNATWHATWNKPATITDARGYRTDFAYVPSGVGAGEPASATRPAPTGAAPIGTGTRPVYSFTYGSFGRVATTTDPTGVVTSNSYNATNGNLNSTTLDPGASPHANAATSFTYNGIGDVLTTTDPRGNVTETAYDLVRRPTMAKHHDGGVGANVIAAERTNYNALGQVTSTEGGLTFSGTSVQTWLTRASRTYTPTGQVATVTNGANNTTTNTYDPVDRLLQVGDPLNRKTRFEYDLAGQVLREIRAYGSSAQIGYARYAYSANGQRSRVIDANNNRSEYIYDGFDRLIELHFPVPALGADQASATDYEGYGYDPNGNRTSLRLRSGEQIGYCHDNLNRQMVKDIPNGASSDVYSGYDAAGRRQFARMGATPPADCKSPATDGQGVEYGYDTAGRLSSETSYGRVLGFQYDSASNRTLVTYPLIPGQGGADFIQYTFDALNRMDQVRENGASSGAGLLADYAYDPLSRRTGIARGNGPIVSASTIGYDNASRLIQLDHDLPSGTAYDQQFDFGYSSASQVTSRTASNDLYGWTTAPFEIDYQRNGLNQYTAVDGIAYAHDPRGNLTSDGSRKFCYDLENRLTHVRANSGALDCANPTAATHRLTYDPLGRLKTFEIIGGAITQFLYDGDRLVAEYNGSETTPLRRYAHGVGIDEPVVWYEGAGLTDRRWLIADHQGSIIAETNAAGAASRYLYGSYGEPGPEGWLGSRFRYTGQIAIGDGNVRLYHYKARVYDPLLGRFLQTDPVGYEDDLNLYGYVRNDPLNNTDPMGRQCNGNSGDCPPGSTGFPNIFGQTRTGNASTDQFANALGRAIRNDTGLDPRGAGSPNEERMMPRLDGTLQIGLSAQWDTPKVTGNVAGVVSAGVALDEEGTVGPYLTGGLGRGGPIDGFFVSGETTITNAHSLPDLGGDGWEINAAITTGSPLRGPGFGGGGGVVGGVTTNQYGMIIPSYTGVQGNLGSGVGSPGFTGYTRTYIWPINPKDR